MTRTREPSDEPRRAKLDSGAELALMRTVLAHERTLMAWIRTSTSLISFGFTIYKFFQYFAQANDLAAAPHFASPRNFGMGMIVIGVFALMLARSDYGRRLSVLEAEYGSIRRSPIGKIAGVVSFLGVGLFLMVWLRI